MSLINEALKKAQRQRTEDPVIVPHGASVAAGAAGGGAPRIPKRRPPMQARSVILLVGGSALLIMAGILGFVMLHDDSPPTPRNRPIARTTPAPSDVPLGTALTPDSKVSPATPPPVVMPPVTTPAPTTVATATVPTPASNPLVHAVIPTAAPNVAEVRLPPVVVPPVVTSAPAHTPAAVEVFNRPAPASGPGIPGLAPTPNPRVYEFLQALKITGIRVSETDPKVIMNDRVFRLNDLVDKSTQLRLMKVTPSGLTFVDVNGVEYQKPF